MAQLVKESARHAGDLGSIPGWGRSPWRRKWQPTPVSWPGEFHGIPWGRQESDTNERLSTAQHHPAQKLTEIIPEDAQTRSKVPFPKWPLSLLHPWFPGDPPTRPSSVTGCAPALVVRGKSQLRGRVPSFSRYLRLCTPNPRPPPPFALQSGETQSNSLPLPGDGGLGGWGWSLIRAQAEEVIVWGRDALWCPSLRRRRPSG